MQSEHVNNQNVFIRRAPLSSSVSDVLLTFILIIIHQHPNSRSHHPCHQHPSCQHSQSSIATSSQTPPASKLQAAIATSTQTASSSPLPSCGLQNHNPSCKPPCLQASTSSHPVIESWRFQDCKFLASNHRVIQSLWGSQDCKVLIGAQLPSNPVSQGATGRLTFSPITIPNL